MCVIMKNHTQKRVERKITTGFFSQLPNLKKKNTKNLYYFGGQINHLLALVVEMPGQRGTRGQLTCNMTASVLSKLDSCLISSSMSMCPILFIQGAVGKETRRPCMCPSICEGHVWARSGTAADTQHSFLSNVAFFSITVAREWEAP